MIDMDKEYQTKDGRKVKILCIDLAGNGIDKVIAKIWNNNGTEQSRSYSAEGRYSDVVSNFDLVEVPKTYWLNVYPGGFNEAPHQTKDEADDHASPDRIACLEFKEGDGV